MPDATSPRILVVDDESSIVVLCQQLLEMAGFRVLTATDPQEALGLLQAHPVDMLLLDVRLPEMDGFELAERARSIQPDLAVVLMTGYNTVETAIKALRSGVDGLLIKPYELANEMVTILQDAFENHHRRAASPDLTRMQPIFNLAKAPLLETSPRALEKGLAQMCADVTGAQHAGVYALDAGRGGLRQLSSTGELPPAGHVFWKAKVIRQALAASKERAILRQPGTADDLQPALDALGWGSLLLVAVTRRKLRYLFVAARGADSPAFLQSDFNLLILLARQAVITLENGRVFLNLAEIAARIEGSQSTLQRAEQVAVQQRLVPPLLREIDLPLQAIKNTLYLAGRSDTPLERARSYLATGQKELYRMEQLLQRVLALTQPAAHAPAPLDMEQVITQALEHLSLVLKEEAVQVRLNIARPLPLVTGVRDQIEQVLYHLILNALDAFNSGETAERVLWLDVGVADGWLNVRLEDSGPGLAAGVAQNLFRPFYTTRPQGSGLGLTVSQKIIHAHGGALHSVPAQHGAGTAFMFTLPLSA